MKRVVTFSSQVLVILSTLTFSQACDSKSRTGPDSSESDKGLVLSAQRAEIEKIYAEFAVEPNISGPGSYQTYPARIILARIHPWFAGGRIKSEVINNYTVLHIPRIPSEVRASLLEASFDDAIFQSGFGLLQKSVWEQLFREQDAGQNFAIIESVGSSTSAVFGVNFLTKKLIALAIFADISTLKHELQHSRQWSGIVGPSVQPLKKISSACLQKSSALFGEMDATHVALPEFRGAVDRAEIAPAWQKEAKTFEPEKTPHYPELRLLIPLFNYPKNVSQDLMAATDVCPVELVEAARKAYEIFAPAAKDVSVLVHSFSAIGTKFYKFNAAFNQSCLTEPQRDPESCAEFRELADEAEQALIRNKALLKDITEKASASPWDKAKALFKDLPLDIRTDLCTHALGAIESGICSDIH